MKITKVLSFRHNKRNRVLQLSKQLRTEQPKFDEGFRSANMRIVMNHLIYATWKGSKLSKQAFIDKLAVVDKRLAKKVFKSGSLEEVTRVFLLVAQVFKRSIAIGMAPRDFRPSKLNLYVFD